MEGTSNRRRLGPSQSPVVTAAVTRLYHQRRARSALKWGAISSVFMILILADMYFCVISFLTAFNFQVVWCAEFLLLVLLFLSVLYDLVLFLGTVLRNPAIKVTTSQKKMLGIPAEVTGFQTVSSVVPFGTPSTPNIQNRQTTPVATPFSGPVTPTCHFRTPGSSHSTPTRTPSFSNSFSHTPNRSSPGHGTSPFTSDRINSINSLEQYLRTEGDKEEKLRRGSPDLASPQSQSYWYGTQSGNGTPILRKYHVATRTLSPIEDEERKDSTAVWNKLGIKRDQLSQYTERCRKWLSQTVMIPVAKEIKSVNETLQNMGSTEVTIGTASLGQLRDLARLRAQQLPSLSMLIRYLDLSSKQDYLVKRILELSEVGGIGNYRWDSGGSWKGRKWDHDLPNDSQIILHFLCTYLDSQVPPSPQFPDGKTFTSQFFLKTPDKPETKKADVCIYQSSINSPHFKVLWKSTCIEIPKGRNNFFHTLIVFLHYIKHEENGLLGQVNLELSGLNLLWIIGS